MSPLWRDQVRFAICPDKLVAVRMAKGMRPRVSASRILHLGTGAGGWDQALRALEGMLNEDAWKHADAAVVLSSAFVRYQLLPWGGALLNGEEQAILARHTFTGLLGDAAGDLEVRVDGGPPGTSSVAAGIPRARMAALQELFRTAGLRLVSIQPLLMAAFNGVRRQLARQPHWFVVVDRAHFSIALLCDRDWKCLRTRPLNDAWEEELQVMLKRESMLNPFAEGVREIALFAPEMQEAAIRTDASWSVRSLRLPLPSELAANGRGAYEIAMAGIA